METLQEFGTMSRHEIHAADLTLLQNFVGIQRITQQFCMTAEYLALAARAARERSCSS